MNVKKIMTENVVCCRPKDSDNKAAQLMWDNDCGVLPVVDAGGRIVGMVTDRDLCMAAHTSGRSLADLSVGDAMSHEVFGCRAQDSVDDALDVMRKHRVRRLPVLDPDEHVVGLLSMNDVVRAVERQGERRGRKSLMSEALGTLSTICEQREAPAAEPATRANGGATAHGRR